MKHIIYIMTAMLGMQGFCTNAMTTTTPSKIARQLPGRFYIWYKNEIVGAIPLEIAKTMSPVFKHIIESPKSDLFGAKFQYDITEPDNLDDIIESDYAPDYSPEFIGFLKALFTAAFPQENVKGYTVQKNPLGMSKFALGVQQPVKNPISSVIAPIALKFSIKNVLLENSEQFYLLLDFLRSLEITYFDAELFPLLPHVAVQYPELLETPFFKDASFCARAAANIIPAEQYSMVGIKDPVELSKHSNVLLSPSGSHALIQQESEPYTINVPFDLYTTNPKQYVDSIGYVDYLGMQGIFSKNNLWLVAALLHK